MYLPVFLIGLLWGGLYRYFMVRARSALLGFAFALSALLVAYQFEIPAVKLLAGIVVKFLALAVVLRLMEGRMVRCLGLDADRRRVGRGDVRSRHRADGPRLLGGRITRGLPDLLNTPFQARPSRRPWSRAVDRDTASSDLAGTAKRRAWETAVPKPDYPHRRPPARHRTLSPVDRKDMLPSKTNVTVKMASDRMILSGKMNRSLEVEEVQKTIPHPVKGVRKDWVAGTEL